MDSIIAVAALLAFFALVALWLVLPASPRTEAAALEHSRGQLPARA